MKSVYLETEGTVKATLGHYSWSWVLETECKTDIKVARESRVGNWPPDVPLEAGVDLDFRGEQKVEMWHGRNRNACHSGQREQRWAKLEPELAQGLSSEAKLQTLGPSEGITELG